MQSPWCSYCLAIPSPRPLTIAMNVATGIVAARMQSLQKLEKTLKRIDTSWKVIETTARVVSPPGGAGFIETLEHTRLAFSRLAQELVAQIAQTHWENRHHDLASRAQVAIDILVRNLFERTADVGFIATDVPLVDFVRHTGGSADAMRARLQAYRSKYTVYDDILLLDLQGQVLLSLQPRGAEPHAAQAGGRGGRRCCQVTAIWNALAPAGSFQGRGRCCCTRIASACQRDSPAGLSC